MIDPLTQHTFTICISLISEGSVPRTVLRMHKQCEKEICIDIKQKQTTKKEKDTNTHLYISPHRSTFNLFNIIFYITLCGTNHQF